MEQLLCAQRDLFGRIARTGENLKKAGEANITLALVQSSMSMLDKKWTKFEERHEQMMREHWEEMKSADYYIKDFMSQAEEKYVQQRAGLLDLEQRLAQKAKAAEQPAGTSRDSCPPRSSLPRIQVPRFSGKYQDWPSFRDLFVSLVWSDETLKDVERLHYLKTSVDGEAEMLLRNFPVTNENFKRAWTTLIQHYENKRLIVSAQFSTFTALPKMTTESAAELRRIYHAVVNTVESLKAIGWPVTNCSDLFVHMVTELLDNKSRREWEESVGDSTDPPALEELVKFLKRQQQTLAALSPSTSEQVSRKSERPNKTVRAHHARSMEADRNSCPLCSKTHYVLFCSKYKTLSANERKNLMNKTNRCLNCLGRHQVQECKSSKSCFQCSKRHHSSMHDAFESDGPSVAEAPPRALAHVSHRTMSEHCGRLLATARVKVADLFGTLHEARALIDQCSEVSLISESLARKLCLERSSSTLSIVGVGSARSGVTRGRVHVSIHSRFGNPCVKVFAFVLQLTSYEQNSCAAGRT